MLVILTIHTRLKYQTVTLTLLVCIRYVLVLTVCGSYMQSVTYITHTSI